MAFHTFRIAYNPRETEKQVEKRRRRRPTKSCMPCRQLKVSCDRKTPCSRCVWSHRTTECAYCEFPKDVNVTPNPSSHNWAANEHMNGTQQTTIQESSTMQLSVPITQLQESWYTPKSAIRGATHWDCMLHKFRDILPDNEEAASLFRVYDEQQRLFPSTGCLCLSPSFPFGCWQNNQPLHSKAELIEYLPPKDVCSVLISRYLDTIERTHCLFHVPSLEEELQIFWEDPSSVSFGWLAQLFALLALGCLATDTTARESLCLKIHEPMPGQLFLEMTEACLRNTQVLFRADLTLCRVLCLVVIIKMSSSYLCTVIDSCGTLTDMAVRGCLELGLHRPSTTSGLNSSESYAEQVVRANLWTAVVYLKVQQAADSGTPLLLRPCDFDTVAIQDAISKQSQSTKCSQVELTYQGFMVSALPVSIDVISTANAPGAGLQAISRMLANESMLRAILQHVQAIEDSEHSVQWRQLQKPMLEIWLRRVLFILYQTALSLPAIDNCMGESYSRQQYLACALGILVYQRRFLEIGGGAVSNILTGIFKQSFFIAAVGAYATLRDNEQPGPGQDQTEWPLGLNAVSTKATIRDALDSCKDLWAMDAQKSKCNFWAHLILQRLMRTM